MMHAFGALHRTDREELAAIASEIRVRVLNVSAAGCLVEANRPLEVGRAATLRLTCAGGDFEDTVQIVRCQEITGSGMVYHVGVAFLTTTPPSIESLRYMIRRQSGRWIGWIRIAERS